MSITISPLRAFEAEAVTQAHAVRYPSLRVDVWVALTALSDSVHQARHWGKDVPGDDDFDSLAEHIACLYDECEILPRPERAVGSILRASEVPAMRGLGRQLGALILELGDAADGTYLAHPRWFDVRVAAEAALVAMES
ncbi:MAG: hypothetical protein HY829_10190 [Actinobacteria bacterium]|nr:hypothetical protein [Actinomycetota bacterium]